MPNKIQFTIPGGRAHFGRFAANGSKTGLMELAALQGFNLNGSPNKIEAYGNATGRKAKLDSTTIGVDYTAKTKLLHVSHEVLAMAFLGDKAVINQASGTETGHEVGPAAGDRRYQLGVTVAKPTGDRKATVTAVDSKEGTNASAWAATTTTAVGDVVVPTVANAHWYMAEASTGDTGAAEPTWPTDGSTVTDGGVTWRDMGVITYTVTTDYTVDAARAQLVTVEGGAIDVAAKLAAAITLADGSEATFSLLVDYSKAALVRNQVIPAGSDVQGELMVNVEDLKGNAKDYYFAKTSITLDGDLTLINEPGSEQYQEVPISIEVLVDDPADPPFYVEDVPS
jgi:hypothetical protein